MNKYWRNLRYEIPLHIVLVITNLLPDNVIFLRLRGYLVRSFLGSCGSNFRLGRNITLYNPINIHIGSDVYIAYGCWFMAGEEIRIDDSVMFGPYCVVVSSEHTKKDGSYRFGIPRTETIKIGLGSWIGAKVVITAGTNIGKGVLVAAAAVVKGDIPDSVVIGGIPARIIKR